MSSAEATWQLGYVELDRLGAEVPFRFWRTGRGGIRRSRSRWW
jgi:hypothetical protein